MSRLWSFTQRFTGWPDSGWGSVWHSSWVRKVQEHPAAGEAFRHSCAVGLSHQGVHVRELDSSMSQGSTAGLPIVSRIRRESAPLS